MHIDLGTLPPDHPLRNRSLLSIEAEYKVPGDRRKWQKITPPFGIAECTYNELGETWKLFYLWRCPSKFDERLIPPAFPYGGKSTEEKSNG